MASTAFDFETLKTILYSSVISDVLDGLGYRDQAMLPFMRPLDDDHVLFGRARTGLFMNTYAVAEGENPYEVEIALIDDLGTDDIVVLGCGGPTTRIAPWGELLTTAALARGATGCVTDGLVRDVRQVRALDFPVVHGGIGPLDSKGRGKMMARDIPIECGGARVEPGDLIFADVDGVVVIPSDVAEEAVSAARAKIEGEDKTREELRRGLTLGEVYEKYGVL
ncbi:RraA family protein [Kaustia mangrovi]|uniref:RraA family protein n=1 Tax=Kaustia mangrovi TaxID=2593653 RepID=A0A7S8C3Z9_9HYPH|nr:RraA family protein [Kaustia mangrovi]QPC42933.1 RraA family protein [Kaustia mangrovi]